MTRRLWLRVICAIRGHDLALSGRSPSGLLAPYHLYTCCRCGENMWYENSAVLLAEIDAEWHEFVGKVVRAAGDELEREILGEME